MYTILFFTTHSSEKCRFVPHHEHTNRILMKYNELRETKNLKSLSSAVGLSVKATTVNKRNEIVPVSVHTYFLSVFDPD